MRTKEYYLDGSRDPLLRGVDLVRTGSELGIDSFGQPVFAEFDGEVTSVRFDGITHAWVVTVTECDD